VAPLKFPNESSTPADRDAVRALIGREPKTAFTVVVRDRSGNPVVIRNAPLEADGTPMPTRYWLVGPQQIEAIGWLEAGGGVRRVQAELDPDEIAATHARHARSRDSQLPVGWSGHRPAGGVAGTRRGVKCLHAHYACWLAGEDDVVGDWVVAELGDTLPAITRGVVSENHAVQATS
jgi:uncharacterized protein